MSAARRRDRARGARPMLLAGLLGLWLAMPAILGAQADLDEQVRLVAAQLRCPVCQNLSVADSPSDLARQMRGVIRQQLQAGKTPEEVKAYFVEKYGDWVLLSPRPRGLNLVVWLGPFAAAAAGLVVAGLAIRRWAQQAPRPVALPADPALLARVRREALDETLAASDERTPGSPLVAERARLYAALRELEFDHRAGKLSAEDYAGMRAEYEGRAAAVVAALEPAPPEPAPPVTPIVAAESHSKAPHHREPAVRPRGWRLATAGVFLLVFGVVIGVSLARALRPRMGEQDTISGDFLTGTGPLGISPSSRAPAPNLARALASGRAAYERQDWRGAIDAFKQALALDRDNPEALAFLGLILLSAGHEGPALQAVERALSREPSYPFALWAKGVVLFEARQDYRGAIAAWEALMAQGLPPEDADQVGRMLIEARARLGGQSVEPRQAREADGTITGTVVLAPSVPTAVPPRGALFIIARKGAGPPLAIQRIDAPAFPLAFRLGRDDVMLGATPFEGEVTLTARLKRDGSTGPAVAGDLEGSVRPPVKVGQTGVEIILDHVEQR